MASGINSIQLYDNNGTVAATVEPSSSQQKAKAVDGQLSISFVIPESYITPGGAPYEVGDGIEVFIYDSNLQLSEVLDETVETLANGQAGLVFNTATIPRAVVVGTILTETNACPARVTIQRNGNNGDLTGRAFSDGFFTEINISADENTFEFQAPNADLTIDLETSTSIYSTQSNFCNQPDKTIELSSPPSNIIEATIDVTLSCKNQGEKISITDLPGASIAYRKSNAATGTQWRLADNVTWNYDEQQDALSGGSFDIRGVEQDENYNLKLSFNGSTYQKNVLIDGPMVVYNEVIDEEVCQ